ncbi:MAG: ABC transporter permease [Saprospiraceae bacterium]|nr:ABC transporter permease [Saprospiraceae bacterium]
MDSTTVIKPESSLKQYFSEILERKELIYFFVWKDIKVRYKQVSLGIVWTIAQPLILMLFFIFIFHKGLSLETAGIPAALYYFSGLIIWNYFSQGVNHCTQSIVSNGTMIRKIYFPRIILSLSSVLTAAFDFIISTLLLLALVIYYSYASLLSINWVSFIISMLLAFMITALFTFSIGTVLSALNVTYRDVRYALPFLVQSFFFITPVIYDSHILKNNFLKILLDLNPLNYSIDLIRTAIQSGRILPVNDISFSSLTVLAVLFLSSIVIFNRYERSFADIV